MPPTRAEMSGVDVPFGSPLSDGFPLPGVLQLAATGDLFADDPAARDGSDPGQPGALHLGPLRILRLLPMFVPRDHGGHRHIAPCNHWADTSKTCKRTKAK